jgi:hypothetical protein
MCRNIKKLRRPESAPTDAELHDAALQFVRKISGYRVPSSANEQAFDRAVKDIAAASRMMFDDLAVGKRSAHSETPMSHAGAQSTD